MATFAPRILLVSMISLYFTLSAAHADTVDWGRAVAFQGMGQAIHPGLIVGFNPQPVHLRCWWRTGCCWPL